MAGTERRLESWKEIAAHFKRDVTTVRRWERRERLPVHRHVHDARSSVYAYVEELDAWWTSRGQPADVSSSLPAVSPVATDVLPRASRRAFISLLALVLLSAFALSIPRSASSPPATEVSSIAVLPFTSSSTSADGEYLSEGLTEALIDSVALVPKLRVIARSSVLRYQQLPPDLQTVARELNARPRQALNWMNPCEVFGRAVASTA